MTGKVEVILKLALMYNISSKNGECPRGPRILRLACVGHAEQQRSRLLCLSFGLDTQPATCFGSAYALHCCWFNPPAQAAHGIVAGGAWSQATCSFFCISSSVTPLVSG
jgi:hypothetical protein